MAANENKCSDTKTSMVKVQETFYGAHEDFSEMSELLGKAFMAEEMEDITDHLTDVMKVVQEGIKKLNNGAAKINDGVKGLSECEGS